jgi:hypothetical protein
MKVSMFRVESASGEGPYAGNEDDKELAHMFAVHGDAEHPDPFDDPMLEGIYPDEVCGFPTLCALEEWFTGYDDLLADAGYKIAVYSVELQSVRYGFKQSVFVRKPGTLPVRIMPMR